MPAVDERTLCPTTLKVCPVKVELIDEFEGRNRDRDENEYTGVRSNVDDEEYDPEFDYLGRYTPDRSGPEYDGLKLKFQLIETDTVARVISCSGPMFNELCPSRIKMDESNLRTGLLSKIRKVISWV